MQIEKAKHPCEIVYNIGANNIKYGDTPGICRITGKNGIGIPFDKWVKKTFTDHAYLFPGDIISNQAAFCFDEGSEILQEKTGRERKQRFRTYSHIIHDNKWYCRTKADKVAIYNHIINGAEIVCLTDTGQKHVFFKHRPGFWQLDEMYVKPNVPLFKLIHKMMSDLLHLGFSQIEIISGRYLQYRILKAGLSNWKKLEDNLKPHRNTNIFNLSAWMQFKHE